MSDNVIDAAHLERQREFSEHTFGPGRRTQGVIAHIREELLEVEANPHDITEWVDVVILALDGAWRHGAQPQEIIDAMIAKQAENEARLWPDWRTMPEGEPIGHVEQGSGATERTARLRDLIERLRTPQGAQR